MRRVSQQNLVLLGVGGLVAVSACSYWGGYRMAAWHYQELFSSIVPIQEISTSTPLVSPLLAYRVPEGDQFGEYQSLKDQIQQEIDTATQADTVTRVSVYFRDLDEGRWVGINQNVEYYPASLLKVPVMIAYYKEAESNPGILDEPVVYQSISDGDPLAAPSKLVPGVSYTIEQLIEAMSIDSDNGATFTLLARINPSTLSEVYANLGIQEPENGSATYQISTRTYALFFRVLYNATYLNPQYSEKALELLSRSTFADGLVAGVPAGIPVAHKFGEHVVSSGNTSTDVELHDCGVVYYPAHPYLLCIMTNAQDVSTASTIIKTISATTYAAIASEYAATTTQR